VGDKVTLVVDTGGSALSAATIHGYAAAVRPANELRALNTEKHFDHISGNSYFRDRGVEIWGHAKLQRTEREFEAEIEEFNQAIPNPARRSMGEARAFFHGTRLAMPDHAIDRDMHMDLGNCTVDVLMTPGHTATNLSVWVAEERVLYTGDCLINQYFPNLDAGGVEDWKIWLRSIDRLAALGARAVMAGHGPVAAGDDVARIIGEARGVLEEAIASGSSRTARS
jgi:cyclase